MTAKDVIDTQVVWRDRQMPTARPVQVVGLGSIWSRSFRKHPSLGSSLLGRRSAAVPSLTLKQQCVRADVWPSLNSVSGERFATPIYENETRASCRCTLRLASLHKSTQMVCQQRTCNLIFKGGKLPLVLPHKKIVPRCKTASDEV